MTTDTTPEIDAMLMQVRDRKTAAGKPLTAVQAGRGPSTMTQEGGTTNGSGQRALPALTPDTRAQVRATVIEWIAEARRQLDTLAFSVDLVLADVDVPVLAPAVVVTADVKLAEKEADQRAFERQQKELAERAQAATFNVAPSVRLGVSPAIEGTLKWMCPEHGEAVVRTSTKTGREYRACPVCGEIERK